MFFKFCPIFREFGHFHFILVLKCKKYDVLFVLFNLLKSKVFDGKVLKVVLEGIVSEVGYLSIKCHL